MSGIGAMMPGILAGGGAGSVIREPATGDNYDANNYARFTTTIGGSPPSTSTSGVVFRWGGVNVFAVTVPYPASAPTSVTVGAYTYYQGSFRSSAGSDPNIADYGIYRTSP